MSTWRNLARGAWVLGRSAVLAVAQNLGLAALALLLAIALWLFVTDRENPTEARTFNSAIPIELVNVPSELAVSNVSETSVRIRIEGSQNELDGLDSEDFRATADLGGLAAGVQSVVVEVEPPNGRVNVVDVTPARIEVTLEPNRTKDVPVRVAMFGSPQAGFAAIGEQAEPESATVSGPESLVGLVESAVAVVNITGARTDIVDQQVPLEARDARDGGISRVTINPVSAEVTIDIEQQEFTLQVAVTANITGEPAAGYSVASISIDPRFATVRGPLDALQSLTSLSTDEVSIADARDDVIRTVSIIVPDGVSIEGSPTARVTIDIAPVRAEYAFQVIPEVINAAAGLIVVPSEAVVVTLTGDAPTLDGIDAGDILVQVDVEGLGTGLFLVPVEVTAPPGTTVTTVDPGELGVAITLPP